MQLITDQNIRVSIPIEDSLKNPQKVSLKIEAAHAGVLNGNHLFYLPKALMHGAESLNTFYKPLQKKHYSKTVGYFYKSTYLPTETKSVYYDKITTASTKANLVSSIKEYLKSKDYQNNNTGFGVLVANAKLYDKNKISELQSKDIGTVSVAGDAPAICSICYGYIGECSHKLGRKYGNEKCFGIIAEDFVVDHISFETIPANWETNSIIIADSLTVGSLELIEEGHLMKLSLSELKEKVSNVEEFLQQLNLETFKEAYLKALEKASKTDFLLVDEKLLPVNTPLTIYVAKKALELLEDSEDKVVLETLLGTLHEDIFKDKTEEEVVEILGKVEEEPVEEPEEVATTIVEETTPEVPEVAEEEPKLEIKDSDKIALAICDSLTLSFEKHFENLFEKMSELVSKENTSKANKLLQSKLDAYKEELESSSTLKESITTELKESLLNQILYLKNVSRDSEYFEKLSKRSVRELKLTLEDHLEINSHKVVETPVSEDLKTLEIKDNLKETPLEKVLAEEAKVEMGDEARTEIKDADLIVSEYLEKASDKMSKEEFYKLYKDVVLEHGTKVGRVLQKAFKTQNKI